MGEVDFADQMQKAYTYTKKSKRSGICDSFST